MPAVRRSAPIVTSPPALKRGRYVAVRQDVEVRADVFDPAGSRGVPGSTGGAAASRRRTADWASAGTWQTKTSHGSSPSVIHLDLSTDVDHGLDGRRQSDGGESPHAAISSKADHPRASHGERLCVAPASDTWHDVDPWPLATSAIVCWATRSFERSLSVWAWFVLGVVVIVWVPMVAVVRLVTAPFDQGPLRRRVPVPQADRRAPVAQSAVAVPHLGRQDQRSATAVRRRGQSPELRRHPADLAAAVGDEVAVEGRLLQVPARRLADAHGRRHQADPRQARLDRRGDGLVQGPPVEACQRDDLSRRAHAAATAS